MTKITLLKTIINNGWNIANRKNLSEKIGKNNFDEIMNLAQNANFRDTFQYSKAVDWFELHNAETTKNTLNSIIDSYKKYAQSPYINDYLRQELPLSEASKNLVDSLKLAINNNKISGKFVRGLSATRKNPLRNTNDVSKFIFDNKGFTSVVPENNADYANCFALGKNGVKIIFDIKDMQAYKASNYEVIFDTNAFTPSKFNLVQESENLYKIIQKE